MPWRRLRAARRNAPLCTTRSSPLSKRHSFALPKREALSTAEQSPSGIGRAAPRLLHFPASHGVKNQWIGETRSHGLPIALSLVEILSLLSEERHPMMSFLTQDLLYAVR